MRQFTSTRLPITIKDVDLDLDVIHREGSKAPILFLHGFGSTKEDYADITRYDSLDNHGFIAYDAPGCGRSACSDLSQISIPFLVKTALAVLDHFDVDSFHVVGHSMGGLTSLMLAHHCPDRVLSFVDIEGNVAPEDCFLSRQIHDYADDDAERFFQDFIKRTHAAPDFASSLYAASLSHKVNAGAVRGIFESMVSLSDHGNLMEKFLGLPCPKMFMYGEQNNHLSYLNHIQRHGVELAEIPHCGHFPMYSNPVIMWQRMAAFWEAA